MLVLIRGAGDLASGIAHRLFQCGFHMVMTETQKPTAVRHAAAFSKAVSEGEALVENVKARLAADPYNALAITRSREIAVLIDPELACLDVLRPDVLVDAAIAKRNLGTHITDAPIVIAAGPGFTAGADCHAVVETKRGHTLGCVYYQGCALPNTGIPGAVAGYTSERLLRTGCDGIFHPVTEIGRTVKRGDVAAWVDGVPVVSAIDGVVRGLLPEGTPVVKGMKAGDVDPRGIAEHCFTISDKARAVGGGVLEAILHLQGNIGKGPYA